MFPVSTTIIPPSSETTVNWYGPLPGDYYYFKGGPRENWYDEVVDIVPVDIQDQFNKKSEVVDHASYYFGLLFNIPHLLLLCQKELRSHVVFIIMIGIAISDLLVFTASISQKYIGDTYTKAYMQGFCGTDRQWRLMLLEWIAKGIQRMGRTNSALLALSMAGIRATTVTFPMSRVAGKLMEAKIGIVITVLLSMVSMVWYGTFYSRWSFDSGKVHDLDCYNPSNEFEYLYTLIDGYTVLTITILHAITTVALLVALQVAKNRRRNLNNDKSANTSTLVTVMAISFFISQLLYSLVFVFGQRGDTVDPSSITIIHFFAMFDNVSRTVLTLNSILHCFLSYFLSSQYRNVVKRLMCSWRSKKNDSQNVNSVVVRTTNT